MPTNGEIIERLTRQLEQQKFNEELQECKTLEDFQKLAEKYKQICSDQNR